MHGTNGFKSLCSELIKVKYIKVGYFLTKLIHQPKYALNKMQSQQVLKLL